MDIKEKITEIVEEAVARLKADDKLLENFKAEPVKVLETLVGKDLPDAQIEKIIDLIKAKLAADDIADTCFNGSGQHILGAQHIGFDRLDGEEFAGRNLLQCCSMENIVHTMHSILNRSQISYITDVELDLLCHLRHLGLEFMAHIVLLLFITGEHADFLDVGSQETVQNGVTKRTGTAGNHQSLVFKNAHTSLLPAPSQKFTEQGHILFRTNISGILFQVYFTAGLPHNFLFFGIVP